MTPGSAILASFNDTMIRRRRCLIGHPKIDPTASGCGNKGPVVERVPRTIKRNSTAARTFDQRLEAGLGGLRFRVSEMIATTLIFLTFCFGTATAFATSSADTRHGREDRSEEHPKLVRRSRAGNCTSGKHPASTQQVPSTLNIDAREPVR